MAFDRSKFKGAKINVLKNTIKEAATKSGFKSNFPGFHRVEEGRNIIRIAPPHEEDSPSLQPMRTSWLKCDLPELDENREPTGKITEQNKKIFITTFHSDLKVEDPIELYIDKCYEKVYNETSDKDERAKKLAPVTGSRISGKWKAGIRPQTSYVAYCWKNGELGRIELNNQIVKRMNELNISEDSDEPIEIDVFSDPDNGVSLIVDYDSSAKSGEKYKVNKKQFNLEKYINESKGDQKKAFELFEQDKEKERVSDEQLEELSKQRPLKDIYVNAYTKSDFQLALNGLTKFDLLHKYGMFEDTCGIFEDEEFVAKLEEIENALPAKEAEVVSDTSDIEEIFTGGSKAEEKKKKVDFSKWTIPQMKEYINHYILENYGDGEEYQLPKLKKRDLEGWCEMVSNEEELPFPILDEGDGSLPEGDIKPPTKEDKKEGDLSNVPESIREKIKALQNKK